MKRTLLCVVGVNLFALASLANGAGVECKIKDQTVTRIDVSTNDVKIEIYGIDGSTLDMANNLKLPGVPKEYIYSRVVVTVPRSKCTMSLSDPNLISCSMSNDVNFNFASPEAQVPGTDLSFSVVRHLVTDAAGRTSSYYESNLWFWYALGDGQHIIPAEHQKYLQCSAKND